MPKSRLLECIQSSKLIEFSIEWNFLYSYGGTRKKVPLAGNWSHWKNQFIGTLISISASSLLLLEMCAFKTFRPLSEPKFNLTFFLSSYKELRAKFRIMLLLLSKSFWILDVASREREGENAKSLREESPKEYEAFKECILTEFVFFSKPYLKSIRWLLAVTPRNGALGHLAPWLVAKEFQWGRELFSCQKRRKCSDVTGNWSKKKCARPKFFSVKVTNKVWCKIT